MSQKATYLDRILDHHRALAANDDRSLADLVRRCEQMQPARGFRDRLAVDAPQAIAVISEIKRKSPSKGFLRADLDPQFLADAYQAGGASCLSVLTDEDFFAGSIEDLQIAAAACTLPVLRKDFTVSAHDVCDTRLMGADALEPHELKDLHHLATSIGLDVLVEIHDEAELEVALFAEAALIGVNQRDLVTFEVDHRRALRMAGLIPPGVLRVAESGVRGPVDALALHQAGYHAVLVGESLVTADDPTLAVRALRNL
ncbi:MAG: indole-3-glycerol phosphate synthase [Actinomycetota bacterium]